MIIIFTLGTYIRCRRTGLSTTELVNATDTGRCCLTWYRLQSRSGPGYNLGLILPASTDWKRSCCSFNAITLQLGARHSASTSSPTTSMTVPLPGPPT